MNSLLRLSLAAVAFFASGLVDTSSAKADGAIRFNRDIRPILANHCDACQGPDSPTRKGGLRLDRREQALAPADSGDLAIVPGKTDASQLVERILSKDPQTMMPPPEANKPLTAKQKELLRVGLRKGPNTNRTGTSRR